MKASGAFTLHFRLRLTLIPRLILHILPMMTTQEIHDQDDLVVWWTGCAIIIKEKKIQNETKKAKNLREEKWIGWQRLPRLWGVKVN